jgi:light-harvesting complex 1 beta chain
MIEQSIVMTVQGGDMEAAAQRPVARRLAPGDADYRQYRRLFGLCFVVFLIVASMARMTGWRWKPWPPGPEGYRSIIAEAKREAHIVVPFAFMA